VKNANPLGAAASPAVDKTDGARQDVATLGTFLVHILRSQDSTWQGTVTLLDKNAKRSLVPQLTIRDRGTNTLFNSKATLAFRSLLELLLLIDSALETEEGD
jgi:hypothetical protein